MSLTEDPLCPQIPCFSAGIFFFGIFFTLCKRHCISVRETGETKFPKILCYTHNIRYALSWLQYRVILSFLLGNSWLSQTAAYSSCIQCGKFFLTLSESLILTTCIWELICHWRKQFVTVSTLVLIRLISVQTALFTNCPTKVNMLHATALRNINSPAKDCILYLLCVYFWERYCIY